MAKKVYRFAADLRSSNPKGVPPRESVAVDAQTRQELRWQEQLSRLQPAILEPEEWEDPLAARECLMSYNASLRRAQAVEVGRYKRDDIDYHVFFDGQGAKNVMTQPSEQKQRRLAHLICSRDGTILRFSLESREVNHDLTHFFQVGIASMGEEELRSLAGFKLMTTRYSREGDELHGVESWTCYYDPERDSVIEVS